MPFIDMIFLNDPIFRPYYLAKELWDSGSHSPDRTRLIFQSDSWPGRLGRYRSCIIFVHFHIQSSLVSWFLLTFRLGDRNVFDWVEVVGQRAQRDLGLFKLPVGFDQAAAGAEVALLTL